MIGVVLDTNVVVSAQLNGEGFEATVLDLALASELPGVRFGDDSRRVRTYPSPAEISGINSDQVEQSLAGLRGVATLI